MLAAVTTEREKMLLDYKAEASDELNSILSWWAGNMVDEESGGFYGMVNNDNMPVLSAPKGIVLNSRILWAFSAAYRLTKTELYLQLATRAFEYIVHHFADHEQGGVFWSVDLNGKLLDGKKQIYGQAFCIYGMAEYYQATGNDEARHFARAIYDHIEQYSFDKERGGYIEAFTREWKAIDDLRLSLKDDNEKKTMNTHLHIIEAYANLYAIWPDEKLQEKIKHLLAVFEQYFINPQTFHLNLFMDENWGKRSSLVSYGHDIEAAWLLLDCAEISGNTAYINWLKEVSIRIADAATEGLDKDGGLWYEYDPVKDHLIKEKHSWPQAEAMVGFFNVYQLTGDKKYLHHSFNVWKFVKHHLKDNYKGEWFWGVNADYSIMQKEKAGFWKCPYHNARACMEIVKRIAAVSNNGLSNI